MERDQATLNEEESKPARKKQTVHIEIERHLRRCKQKPQEKRARKTCENNSEGHHRENRKQVLTVGTCGARIKPHSALIRLTYWGEVLRHCDSIRMIT